VRERLAAKRGSAPRHARPELYPTLAKFKPGIDFTGEVARSCMHCHMIGTAERETWRRERKPLPDDVLFPWPMPDVIGMRLDPGERATVLEVAGGSAAANAGLRAGDRIVELAGQPLLSIADVQWVLHRAPDPASLDAVVSRGDAIERVRVELASGWRRRGDISWRTTSWDLRRMVTGGLLLVELPQRDRARSKIAADGLGLLVEHVGEYGEHRTAKDAGFRKGDIVVEWDGRSDRWRETEILAHGMQKRRAGERIAVTVLRDGKRVAFELLMR